MHYIPGIPVRKSANDYCLCRQFLVMRDSKGNRLKFVKQVLQMIMFLLEEWTQSNKCSLHLKFSMKGHQGQLCNFVKTQFIDPDYLNVIALDSLHIVL